MRVFSMPSSAAALAVMLLVLLMSGHARADLALAPTTSYIPITSYDQLVRACDAASSGSTPESMYGAAVKEYVNDYMSANSATQAFVAAYRDGSGWYWRVTQMGETTPVSIEAGDFTGGVLPDGTTGKFAIYNTATQKLQAVDGTNAYQVLCYVEKTYQEKKKDSFPWWAILILVLGIVVIIAVVLTVVLCCCCRKKKRYTDDDDDESALASRSGSFSTRGTSRSGSSHTGSSASSSAFSSRGSSFSGTSKSSAATGSTAGSDSQSDATSQGTDTTSHSSVSRSSSVSSRSNRAF